MILKGRMKIRLGGMSRITSFRKKAQVRYFQGVDQPFFRGDTVSVGLGGEKGMNKQK